MIDDRLDLMAAVAELESTAGDAITSEGVAHLVVPGGRSPARLFAALVARRSITADWQLHLADERVVPIDHPARNAPHVARALGLGIEGDGGPSVRLRSPLDLDDAEEAARRYAATFADVPEFAAVVLGLGADGHVASVFPGDATPLDAAAADALLVSASDPVAPRRITLSVPRLSRARLLLLVVDGDGKDAAVDAVLQGRDVPANAVRARRRVLVDLRTLPHHR